MIIGVGQVSHQPSDDADPAQLPDAIDLMAEALAGAEADTGAGSVLPSLHTVAVVGGLWRYKNPAQLVADQLGFEPPSTTLTTFGGNLSIQLTHVIAEQIRNGEIEAAAILGGEANLTRRYLKRHGLEARRRNEDGVADPDSWGPPLDMGDRVAVDRGGEFPRNSYAIIDSAIRHRRGETIDEGRRRAAETWAGFARVAADNPHASDRSAMSADEIREVSADNRMVSWPYTKAMCANNTVDKAGAIIICSHGLADRLGVSADRRVYPWHCAVANDTDNILEREHLAAAPAMAKALSTSAEVAGGVDAIDHLDLYSCFPSIAVFTTEALGISTDRQLTVSGGLGFSGAPLNFAAGEGLIAMVDTLRNAPGSLGLVQGNGGHATKHAIGLYSTTPPSSPHAIDEIEAPPSSVQAASADHSGAATIEGITVEFEKTGPSRAIAIVRFDNGSRGWANSTEPGLLQLATTRELVGEAVEIEAGLLQLV